MAADDFNIDSFVQDILPNLDDTGLTGEGSGGFDLGADGDLTLDDFDISALGVEDEGGEFSPSEALERLAGGLRRFSD